MNETEHTNGDSSDFSAPASRAADETSDDPRLVGSDDTASLNDAAGLEGPDGEWLGDDLERAYQQALDAVEAVEWHVELESRTWGTGSDAGQMDDAEAAGPGDGFSPTDESGNAIGASESSTAPIGEPSGSVQAENVAAEGEPETVAGRRVTPRQIVEAVLFVGGQPLTTKKLASLFRDEFGHEFLERLIDDLNRQYSSEHRPYEIRFGEGGYRLTLRPEYEKVRNRVYGLGPKEVKLSQEALEVLALVAYRQPISKQQIEEAGKANAGGLLRQLLRRELVCIERGEKGRSDIKYRTTPRFLQLFGLGDLDELPQAEELNFK